MRSGRGAYGSTKRDAAGVAALAVVVALGLATAHARASGARPERAAEARTVFLEETGHLKTVGEPGTVVEERGHATGTYACSIEVRLTIEPAGHVVARFTVRPKGGSVTGSGSARFEQKGADGYFGGTLEVSGGSGNFKHASGSNIGVSGVIDRETLALTVHVRGQIAV
jgi:hypothetical protein